MWGEFSFGREKPLKRCLTSKLAAFFIPHWLKPRFAWTRWFHQNRGELVQVEIHPTWWPCRVVGRHLLAEPGRPLLALLALVEFGTNGKCGEAWAGWRALCYPSSPCLPLSLQSTSHSESNTEPQRRDAARFRITPLPHLPTRALWSRFLDPPILSWLWVRGKRRENLQSSASTGLLATSSRSAFLRHCDFNCGCINTKWLHCSRRWWERELCILTALRQNFSGTATHRQGTNSTQPSLFSCTITFSTRIRNGRRLLGKMDVPSQPPSIFRPPWSWWQKAIRGRIWAQVVLLKSTMWRVWGGPESPTATSMIEDRWIIKSHSWSQHFTGNWLSQVSHLRYVWTNRSAFGISEECRKVQRRHFCRLFFGGGALPSAKWKELSLLGFSDAPPHLCSCGKSEL